eukprot:gene8591-17720_t
MLSQGIVGPEGQQLRDLSIVRLGRAGGIKNGSGGHDGGAMRGDNGGCDSVCNRSVDSVSKREKQTSDDYGRSTHQIKLSILETADIICSTLSGAGSSSLLEALVHISNFSFDAVIIDEAAQAVEPSSLIPLKYNPQ